LGEQSCGTQPNRRNPRGEAVVTALLEKERKDSLWEGGGIKHLMKEGDMLGQISPMEMENRKGLLEKAASNGGKKKREVNRSLKERRTDCLFRHHDGKGHNSLEKSERLPEWRKKILPSRRGEKDSLSSTLFGGLFGGRGGNPEVVGEGKARYRIEREEGNQLPPTQGSRFQ